MSPFHGLATPPLSIYATAQLTPKAVPIAANTAEARFHRNLISLDLFSWVIHLSSIILIVQHSFIHRVFLSTDYHRFTQIFLISKDIVIITDYFSARKSTAFSKTRLLAPHWYNHGTSWLRLAGASSRLSLLCGNEPSLYFSIALMQIKPFLCAAQPCLF